MNGSRNAGCLSGAVTLLVVWSVGWTLGCAAVPAPPNPLAAERTISSNTTSLAQKWKYRIDGTLSAPLAFEDGMVYVPQGATLEALDASTGKVQWSFTNHDRVVSFSPDILASQDVVAFHTAGPFGVRQKINVVDGKTGKPKWDQRLSTVYSFAIGDGRLYVGSLGHVGAYDIQNGSPRWETSEGLPARSVINVYYADGQVYATTYNRVHRLDSEDGHERGSFEYTNAQFEILSQGAFFSVAWPQILRRSANTGAIQWEKEITPDATYVPPTLVGHALYVLTSSGALDSLDVDTGAVNWESKELGTPFSNVVSFNGRGYVVSRDASVRSFDLGTGKEEGALTTTPHELASRVGVPAIPSLAVVGEYLVITFGDSYIFGFAEGTP